MKQQLIRFLLETGRFKIACFWPANFNLKLFGDFFTLSSSNQHKLDGCRSMFTQNITQNHRIQTDFGFLKCHYSLRVRHKAGLQRASSWLPTLLHSGVKCMSLREPQCISQNQRQIAPDTALVLGLDACVPLLILQLNSCFYQQQLDKL